MLKIHVDNIDNDDGKIWAVQDGKKYYRVHGIITQDLNLETRISTRQPRAYLIGKGTVKIVKIGNATLAVLTGK